MNWATMRAALKAQAIAASGLSAPGAVEWKGSKEAGYSRPFPRCDMSLRSIVPQGVDEVFEEYNVDTDLLDVKVIGWRQMTWTLRVESENHADASIPLVHSERLRARLRRPSIGAALRAAGIGVSTIESTQLVAFKSQDRDAPVAVIDVILNLVENDTDDTAEAGEFVQLVTGQSDTINDPTNLPAREQVTIRVEAP